VECNATRMCELLVGLPDVNVLAVDDQPGQPLRVHVETCLPRPSCGGCGSPAWVKDRPVVELVDLPCFGRPARLVWRKHRWVCPSRSCAVLSWTGEDSRIASARVTMTDRAGRWVTAQVGQRGRTVNEIAVELGSDWHTINDTVIAYGTALVEDPGRFGTVNALGLDETLFARRGPWRTQVWCTSITDVRRGQLLDVVEGRNATAPGHWLLNQPAEWRERIRWATLDLSGPYRKVLTTVLPRAVQVADPFHVVKLAGSKLDECRRRVQNETLGHRGHKHDPLYRCRRLLTKADERLDGKGRAKLLGLLAA
jgi:transposase